AGGGGASVSSHQASVSRSGGEETTDRLSKTSRAAAENFWAAIAKDFFWKTKHTGRFLDYNFDVTKGEIFVKCMEGATTNICYNLLDRNVHERKLGDKIAFFWSVERSDTDGQRIM
uniref:Acetyl-coenzyme A synthetase N-terminal domain-containing protein n=1 Tax=Poecilia reticulata TaxID=8081 RepID=A0A3P9MZ90_POERE